ncbi:MAG: cellulase family glycosylhydrolase, partial [Sphingomonas sp.]|nr:cellulase family glycosylhydrolase [Sphingomonas sp.]
MWKSVLGLALALTASKVSAKPALQSPFHRGVNVLGYDPYWTDESKRRFQWRHFREIRSAGFDFVRLNLQAFRHMDAQNRLEPAWLGKLDDVLREAHKAGLGVIVDEHDFN